MRRRASFSRCRRYRYALERCWAPAGGRLAICMLNPSTADGVRDDPTIRRCIRFARDWGFGAVEIVNLYALRATRPAELRRAAEAVGPGCDRAIRRAAGRADAVLVAWGAAGARRSDHADRVRRVRTIVEAWHAPCCLGTTRRGAPRHPLYVPAARRPRPCPPARSMPL